MFSTIGRLFGDTFTKLKNWGVSNNKDRAFFPVSTFVVALLCIWVHFRQSGWGFSLADLKTSPLVILQHQFTHIRLEHLSWNMLFLLLLGPPCEKYLGHLRWLLFFLASGCFAALGFGIYNPQTILIGASGSIAGLMAIYPFCQRSIVGLILSGLGVLFYFSSQFFLSIDSIQAGIVDQTAYLGHVAGGVGGLILFSFINRRK